MTPHISRINVAPYIGIIALVAITFLFKINLCIEARSVKERDAEEFIRTKGTVKTIQSEDGDLIDCVDIYKQPAFDHPLLKNHTIQDVKRQNSHSMGIKDKFYPRVSQIWNRNEHCPQGTIPIIRTTSSNVYKNSSPSSSRRHVHVPGEVHNEYATASTDVGSYYGGHAVLNLWNPQPEILEFSLVQMWVAADAENDNDHETIEVGWHVFPGLYRDYQTRFFIYWTKDNYVSTGCYNLRCPGFVQTNPNIAIGGVFSPTSVYGGDQSAMLVDVYKDPASGNWILYLNQQGVGYWPTSIFNHLAVAATALDWGGEIYNGNTEHHTTTPMGSGHFSIEGYQRASYINEIRVVNASGTLASAGPLDLYLTNQGCYDIRTVAYDSLYLGGPGYSNTCP